MGVLYAALAMMSFASNMLITRVALTRMPVEAGFFIVLTMNVAFPAALFAVEIATRSEPLVWHWEGAGYYTAAGIIGIYLGRRLLFDTVKLLGAARASIFHSSSPAFAFLAAWLLIGETMSLSDMALVAVVWVGLWLTQPRTDGQPGIAQLSPETRRRGFLLGMATVAGFGFGNVLRGLAVREWDEVLFGTALSSLAALVLHTATTRNWGTIRSQLAAGPRSAWLLYTLCGIATVCGSIFVTMAMRQIQIGLAVLIVHTTPIVVFPVTAFVLKNKEELGVRTLVGTALVLGGIAALVLT